MTLCTLLKYVKFKYITIFQQRSLPCNKYLYACIKNNKTIFFKMEAANTKLYLSLATLGQFIMYTF